MMRLVLAPRLCAQIAEAARTAFPRECCGLIEGVRDGDTVRVGALHATRNIAGPDNRFEIDPAEHFALLRKARGTARAIVGCYHSHPNGVSEPSALDRKMCGETGFIWLVIGVSATATLVPRAFCDDGLRFVPLELVTS